MRLVRRAGFQRHLDGGEHGLLVMLESQSQDLDHLAVAARRFEHALLQSPKGKWELGERRAVTQRSRLALDDRKIMPPVENGGRAFAFMRAGEYADVLADDLPLSDDDDALGIDSHADRAIGEEAGTL